MSAITKIAKKLVVAAAEMRGQGFAKVAEIIEEKADALMEAKEEKTQEEAPEAKKSGETEEAEEPEPEPEPDLDLEVAPAPEEGDYEELMDSVNSFKEELEGFKETYPNLADTLEGIVNYVDGVLKPFV